MRRLLRCWREKTQDTQSPDPTHSSFTTFGDPSSEINLINHSQAKSNRLKKNCSNVKLLLYVHVVLNVQIE